MTLRLQFDAHTARHVLTAALLLLVACLHEDAIGPRIEQPILASIVVSDAVAAGTDVNQPGSVSGVTDSGSTYISIPAGAIPNGVIARIRNRRSGDTVSAAMIAGGLDPVRVSAHLGDTLVTSIELSGTMSTVEFSSVVPAGRAPSVVRTVPPRRKKDVPRNPRIIVVFSEPIDRRTLTPGAAKLVRGSAAEPGEFRFTDASGLTLEFVPAALLVASTNYELVLTQDIRDLDGEPLAATVRVEFTTGAATAVASIVTTEAAVVLVEGRGPRAFTMDAALLSDGRFSGSFSIYYADLDRTSTGPVKCFSVLEGKAAWVSGEITTINGAPVDSSWGDLGWQLQDNGLPESLPPGAPPRRTAKDLLTLAGTLQADMGSAQDFCDKALPRTGSESGVEVLLRKLESGDFTISGAAPPPTPLPAPGAMSQIAYYTPDNAIRVMNADGSNPQPITVGSGDSDPTWSPDRARIAFSRRSGSARGIYVINANRSGLRLLTQSESDHAPAWSPTGQAIAFVRSANIWLANPESGSLIQLTTDNASEVPAWSPDGSSIAFARGSPSKIWVMQSDGTGQRQLSDSIGVDTYPAWSPDGGRVAFERRLCDQSGTCAQPSVTVVNIDGSGARELTREGRTPTWSPDGKRLAFEDYGITVVNVSGGGRVRLGTGFRPKWSLVGTTPVGPEPSTSIEITGGNNQADTVFSTLATPLRVRVTRDGSLVSGARVNWLLTGGGPAPNPHLNTAYTTTDSVGAASVLLTLGKRVGPVRIRAVLIDGTGLTDGVEFTATAKPGRPVSLAPASSEIFTALADSTYVHAVVVRDAYQNAVSGVRVEWSVDSGGGTIQVESDTTAAVMGYPQPMARVTHRLGSNEGQIEVKARAPGLGPSADFYFHLFVVTRMVGVEVWNGDAFGFSPDTVVVPVDKTVMWTWDWGSMSYSHEIVFEGEPLPPAGMAFITDDEGKHLRTFSGPPRTVRYRCTLHSESFTKGEVGVVIVR